MIHKKELQKASKQMRWRGGEKSRTALGEAKAGAWKGAWKARTGGMKKTEVGRGRKEGRKFTLFLS